MITKQINFNDFCNEFIGTQYENQYSYEGKMALFDYLDNLSDECSEPIELDIVAIACDYTEYESLEELQKNYTQIESMEDLEDNTQVIPEYDYKGTKLDRFIVLDF